MVQKMIETRPWDAAEHLETEEDIVAYLDAALEEGDLALVVETLGDVARAIGMNDEVLAVLLARSPRFQALLDRSRRSIAFGKGLSRDDFWNAVAESARKEDWPDFGSE